MIIARRKAIFIAPPVKSRLRIVARENHNEIFIRIESSVLSERSRGGMDLVLDSKRISISTGDPSTFAIEKQLPQILYSRKGSEAKDRLQRDPKAEKMMMIMKRVSA